MIITGQNGIFINADYVESIDTTMNVIHMASGRNYTISDEQMSALANYLTEKERNQTFQSY